MHTTAAFMVHAQALFFTTVLVLLAKTLDINPGPLPVSSFTIATERSYCFITFLFHISNEVAVLFPRLLDTSGR
jgi:hypothetical protein